MGADDEVLVHGVKGPAFVFRARCRSRKHPFTAGVLQCVLQRVAVCVTVCVAVCTRLETSV